jgi:hypothetical protein
MRPVEFVLFDGDSSPNTPVREVFEAMQKDMIISTAFGSRYVVESYYYYDGRMYLDISEVE